MMRPPHEPCHLRADPAIKPPDLFIVRHDAKESNPAAAMRMVYETSACKPLYVFAAGSANLEAQPPSELLEGGFGSAPCALSVDDPCDSVLELGDILATDFY